MIAAATSSNGQRIDLAPGVTLGHFLIRHHDVTIAGPKRGNAKAATVRADGQFGTVFQVPYPLTTPDGQPVSKLTLRDLTVDGDSLTALSSLVGGTAAAGPLQLDLENVELVNVSRSTIALLNANRLTATSVHMPGLDGGGVKIGQAATSTVIRSCSTTGGKYGLQDSDPADASGYGTIPGIDVDGYTDAGDYWHTPTAEVVTPTAFTASYVDVESHVNAHRSLYDCVRVLTPVLDYDSDATLRSPLVQVWDLVETADAWSRVMPDGHLDAWRARGSWRIVPQPGGEATVYRIALGRSYNASDTAGNRIYLRAGGVTPPSSTWRTISGAVTLPSVVAGMRVDIIRHGLGGGPRDFDVGGIHITEAGLDARLARCSVRGRASDNISCRGRGTVATHCYSERSQDTNFTLTADAGGQVLKRCQSTAAGVDGYFLGHGASRLESCTATDNGRHGEGWGVLCYEHEDPALDGTGSRCQVRGNGGSSGLISRSDCLDPDGFPRPTRRRPVRHWGLR